MDKGTKESKGHRGKNQGNKETSGQGIWREKKKKTRRQPYEEANRQGANGTSENEDNSKKGIRGNKGKREQKQKETRGSGD